jgi:ferredoxin
MPGIIEERCPQNHECPAVTVCPVDALIQEGHNAPYVDSSKCISCNECVKFCPRHAIVPED